MMVYDTIVIGAGVAGLTAALNLRRGGLTTLLLEQETVGGQVAISPRIENIPSIVEISGEDYIAKLFDQVLELGTDFELEEVQSVEKNADIFTVKTNYNTYQAKTAIIASGVVHRQLGVHNEEHFIGHGLSYCAVCDGAFYKDKEIVVIGDANSALQYAFALAKTSKKVHICALFDHLFADKILIDRLKDAPNIDVTFNLSLKEFLGNEKLEGLRFVNTQTEEEVLYKVDGCFVAIGQLPNNERYQNLVDLNNGFIVVDKNMQTKTTGLYAAGDCIDKKYRQIVLAENDGAIAAISIINYLAIKN